MMSLLVIGTASLGITVLFWLIFAIGVRNCQSVDVGDFMVAGTISMLPLFVSFCCFMFAGMISGMA